MNVLIVGGAGYVGGAITNLIQKNKNMKFRIYDALFYENEYLKNCDFVFGDIRDRKKLKKNLDWSDKVIWLAAIVGDPACALNPQATIDINYESIKFLKKNYRKKIIFISTCSVYGEQENLILNENSKLNPISLYAETKLKCEKILSDTDAIIFRLGTLFGHSGEYGRLRLDLVVNVLVFNAQFKRNITIMGGNQNRPLLHVKDAAQTMIDSLKSKKNGVFNLHKTNIKILDLGYKVKKKFSKCKIKIVPTDLKDARNYLVSSKKANKELKFKPKYSIDHGINEIKTLFEENRIKNINNKKYSNLNFLQSTNLNF